MNQWQIAPVDKNRQQSIQARIDNKTKPLGALGQLESLALQLALIQGTEKISIENPTVLVFAGDHGVAAEGISIAPSEVTSQMVANFLSGGAAINCFCRSTGMAMKVIDAGVKLPVESTDEMFINQSVGFGTKNLALEPAMTTEQLHQCLEYGQSIASEVIIGSGSNVLAFGEMGIGNTTSAAAILASICDLPLDQCVGRGTGINDEQLTRKKELIEKALARFDTNEPLEVLRQVGGFEIGQIVGAMLAAGEQQITIVVDGFIVTSAALIAHKINPNVLDYMVFAHCSDESGHQKMLQHLQAKPLLNLGMRLGEGTGAALALPLIKAAASFYNDMATFESAGVTV